jgi:hypothetical protein
MDRRQTLSPVLALLPLLLASPPAAAEGNSFGGRVGGYGFRAVDSGGSTHWTECRMDGLGIFLQRDFDEHFFAEVGVDLYQAHGAVVTEGMDRMSTLGTAAVGLRMFPGSFLSQHIEAGFGGEVSQITLGDEAADTYLLPLGFLGMGAELELGDHLRLGATIRLHWMMHPDEAEAGAAGSSLVHAHERSENLVAGAAGQAQFFARYIM